MVQELDNAADIEFITEIKSYKIDLPDTKQWNGREVSVYLPAGIKLRGGSGESASESNHIPLSKSAAAAFELSFAAREAIKKDGKEIENIHKTSLLAQMTLAILDKKTSSRDYLLQFKGRGVQVLSEKEGELLLLKRVERFREIIEKISIVGDVVLRVCLPHSRLFLKNHMNAQFQYLDQIKICPKELNPA